MPQTPIYQRNYVKIERGHNMSTLIQYTNTLNTRFNTRFTVFQANVLRQAENENVEINDIAFSQLMPATLQKLVQVAQLFSLKGVIDINATDNDVNGFLSSIIGITNIG